MTLQPQTTLTWNLHLVPYSSSNGNITMLECNDLFSRFEQQTSILEKTGRSDGPHDGPSRARRTVVGSRFKTLRKSEIGYWKSTLWTSWWNGRTDRHRRDGPSRRLQWKSILWTLRRPAGRTVAGPTARHRLRKSQAESDFLTRFKGRFWTIPSLIIDFVGLY